MGGPWLQGGGCAQCKLQIADPWKDHSTADLMIVQPTQQAAVETSFPTGFRSSKRLAQKRVVRAADAALLQLLRLVPVSLSLPGVGRQGNKAAFAVQPTPGDTLAERIQSTQRVPHGLALVFLPPQGRNDLHLVSALRAALRDRGCQYWVRPDLD